ncbi:peptidase S8, partial [Mesorhizobium sp. M4B.F.Ca.ET.089.01.1.1]
MAAKPVIAFGFLLAAMTIAATPVFAQSEDQPPAKTECPDGTNAAGADCAKDDGGGTPGAGPAGAVFLPALIVD